MHSGSTWTIRQWNDGRTAVGMEQEKEKDERKNILSPLRKDCAQCYLLWVVFVFHFYVA